MKTLATMDVQNVGPTGGEMEDHDLNKNAEQEKRLEMKSDTLDD